MSDEIGLLHVWVDGHRDEIVQAVQGVLRIPSVEGQPAGLESPYGEGPRKALDYTLDLCRRMGFRTKDVGGYAGHAEFGEGEEMIAALGHLDVVPEGEGWLHPPYAAEIQDGYIYARGAIDDKGSVYAALFGAKAVMDSAMPLRRRVRVIFGCDEESGFGCVKHYWGVAGEERPTLAFTPDADFPLVYAEKGIVDLVLERSLDSGEHLRVVSAEGGLRPNMVPESANARIEGDTSALHRASISLSRHWDRNVSYSLDESGIHVTARGKSAHGSTPVEGDNAIWRLARALRSLELPADREWIEWIDETADHTGRKLGIRGEDEVAGPLTSNLGLISLRDGVVRLTYNIRYPVTWTIETLLARHSPVIEPAGWRLIDPEDSPPLHVPLDQEPVRTLLRIYRQETGDYDSQPKTMGGGTYARATPNCVAFGPDFPGSADGPAHQPDERISIDNLIRATKIYAHAIYELAK